MTAVHATNAYNVQATLNAWLIATLATLDRPYFLPDYAIVVAAPESDISTPSFSVNHIDVGAFDRYQGRAAQYSVGIMEVNVWVSRSNGSWLAQKMFMQAMVQQAVLGQVNGVVVVNDYADPFAPTPTSYRAILSNVQAVSTAPDPNPDLERVRMLVDYRWTIRS